MFRRILCVVLGGVTTSLIPIVEPAQALSLHSGGYDSYETLNPYNLLGGQQGVFAGFPYETSSSSLFAQVDGSTTESQGDGSGLEEGDDDLGQAIAFAATGAAMVVIVAEILSNNGNGRNGEVVSPIEVTQTVPSPALLPGLIGMGVAAIRKRNQTQADEA